MNIKEHNPMHPGEFIKRVYLEPNGKDARELSVLLHISESLMSRIINAKGSITSETALKLSKVLARSPESWLLMQDQYDLSESRQTVDLSHLQEMKLAG